MAQVVFQQGEDIIIELAVIENSVPVNLSTNTSIRVQLLVTQNNVKSKLYSYSSNSKTGYGVCRIKTGTGNENIVQVLVTRAESVNFVSGALSFAVVATLPGGSDFPNGINKEYNFDNFGTIQDGVAKDEIIP